LSATTSAAGGGGKITGAGTTHLTITGTLAQVNADLSTLTDLTKGQGPGDDDDDHESDEDWGGSRDRLGFEADDDEDDGGSSGNPDKITINASDSRGANAVPQSIIVSTNAPPVINAPDSIEIEKDRSFTVEDVRISDADAARAKVQITVSLRDTYRLLSATTHVYGGGGTISGNQTTSLTITGPVAQVNADLSTLVDKENSPKPDKIVVTASDSQDGTALAKTIAIEFGDDREWDSGHWTMASWQDNAASAPSTALLGNYMAAYAPAGYAGSSPTIQAESQLSDTWVATLSPTSRHG
jgi:hypothetical protein